MYFKPSAYVVQTHRSIKSIYNNTPKQMYHKTLDNRCILNDTLKRQQVSGAENIVEYNNTYFGIDIVDVKDFKMHLDKTTSNTFDSMSVINWKLSKDDGYVLYGFDCLLLDNDNVKEIRRYFDEGMTTYANEEIDHML